jgi:hypothetical protein
MSGVLRAGAAIAATVVLLVPAIWNRFPLLQYDTGGYVARWFEGYLVPSRSNAYGLFLAALAHPDFWPVVMLQAAATVFVLALTLRATGFGGRPILLLGVTSVLAALTTLPWLASILLTDIFAALAVLALYLLVFADAVLGRWERRGLIALIAFAAACHSATFAVVLALLGAGAIACIWLRSVSRPGLARGAGALALGAVLLLAANFATSGRIAWTPGGTSIPFGRMLQDGIVARYLAEHCPDRRLPLLCAHRHELPTNADAYFWGQGVFDRLGRFKALDGEMHTVVIESVRAYPALQAQTALTATARQLVRVRTGEGVVDTIWHTYAIIERYVPSVVADMRAARQQLGQLRFDQINRIHVPVALGSMLLLLLLMLGWRRAPFADLSRLAATAAIALLANAVVCGVLSNPHDRYGARMAWLAPLIVTLVLVRLFERWRVPAPDVPALAGDTTAAA